MPVPVGKENSYPIEQHNNNDIGIDNHDVITAQLVVVDASNTVHSDLLLPLGVPVVVSDQTWTDRFYDNEPNIVAVFDIDHQALLQFQTNTAITWTLCSSAMLIFSILCESIDEIPMAVIFLIVCIVLGHWAFQAGRKAQAAYASLHGGGIHLAITTVSVRYDQLNPTISTEISLQDITSCSFETRTIQPFCGCCSKIVLNLVELQIRGSTTSKVYIGIRDPKNFVNLVMRLKEATRTPRQDGDMMMMIGCNNHETTFTSYEEQTLLLPEEEGGGGGGGGARYTPYSPILR